MPHASTAAAPIAEVTASSITDFVAECLPENKDVADLAPKPRFGSFLKVLTHDQRSIFAVAYNVKTGPHDSIHKPAALGLTREELRLQQPHIFSLLRTEVVAILVGHGFRDQIYQHLPPQPPDVHDFVYPATSEEIRSLTRDFEFLRLLAYVKEVPSDELMAATIREAHRALGSDDDFLLAAGRALSTMMRSDYDRLLTVLRKIKP